MREVLAFFALLSFAHGQACTGTTVQSLPLQSVNSLCEKTFADANATGFYSFQPDVFGGSNPTAGSDFGFTANVTWAYSVYTNATTTQGMIWFNTGGANYSDDVGLGYDVCYIPVNGLTAQAQYNGQHDDGTCSSTLDSDCITDLTNLATDTARMLVDNPTPDPGSNLTAGVLPEVCNDIATALKNDLPRSCHKFYNNSAAVIEQSIAFTDYEDKVDGSCIDDPSGCTINSTSGTFWGVSGNFLEAPDNTLYDELTHAVYPALLVFLPIANVDRSVTPPGSSHLTCIHIDHYNPGSRVSPELPSPPAADHGDNLSGGAIAGIVVGVVVALGLLAGAAFFWWWRKRKTNRASQINSSVIPPDMSYGGEAKAGVRSIEKAESLPEAPTKPPTPPETLSDEPREAPDTSVPSYDVAVYGPGRVERPELPSTKSHERYELWAPPPRPLSFTEDPLEGVAPGTTPDVVRQEDPIAQNQEAADSSPSETSPYEPSPIEPTLDEQGRQRLQTEQGGRSHPDASTHSPVSSASPVSPTSTRNWSA